MLKTFSKVVTQFDGTPWKNEKGEPLTVAHCVVTALLGSFEGEQTLNGEEKLKRYILAERIYGAGSTPTEVSSENIVLMKACVSKAFATAVVGFVFTNLESAEPAT